MERLSQIQQKPGPSSSSTIMSGFHTPASAFYATERFMGFPENGSHFPSPRNSFSFSTEPIAAQHERDNIDLRNTLQSLVKSQICFNQYPDSSQVSYKIPGNDHAYGHNKSRAVVNNNHNKTRIRWTQDLHDKFVESVKRLGGSEKATPKTILKLMETQGLTIFHVKSHLQKYRIAKYMPDSAQAKSEKTTDLTHFDVDTGLHLTEALQLQLDVQRRLHEQLEFQRNLQLRIEEQGRQLKMMIDQQQKTNETLFKNQDYLDIASFSTLEASIAESSANVLTSSPS